MVYCDICNSLIGSDGKCTNERCGTGNHVTWAKVTPPQLALSLKRGSLTLITAPKGTRAGDLGGPPIGMTAK